MTLWFGPDVGPGVVCVGPVRIEKWRKQPHRSLLFGAAKGDEKTEVRPGLSAALGVSKGMPKAHSDASMFCAGVRLTESTNRGPWRCFCDLRVTLLGERREVSRTVRWILTPDAHEMFFPLLPLTDAERFLTANGALRVKVELLFHFYLSKDPCPGDFESGAQDTALRALMYAWRLAGHDCLRAAGPPSHQAVFRDSGGPVSRADVAAPRRLALEPWAMRPGLLRPSMARHWSCGVGEVQEVVPGFWIGLEKVVEKMVKEVCWPDLVEIGVQYVVQLQGRDAGRASWENVQMKLFEMKDGEWVQGTSISAWMTSCTPCPDSSETAEAMMVEHLYDLLQWVLGAVDPTKGSRRHGDFLVCSQANEAQLCTELVVKVVAKGFQMSTATAQRYLGHLWDVPCLHGAEEPPMESPSDAQLVAWLDSSESLSLAAVKAWNAWGAAQDVVPWYGWQPDIPGTVLHVHETGWGAVPEIFKAFLCHTCLPENESTSMLSSLVTLHFSNVLPQDEVLAVPHSFELGDTWHLVALICLDGTLPRCGVSVHPGLQSISQLPRMAFLHGANGAKEWFCSPAALLELRRHVLPTAGPPPNNWLCVRDLSPEFIVYMRGAAPGNMLPLGQQPEGIPGAPLDPEVLQVRIVTDKALQKTRGNFEGASAISASAVLKLPATANLEDLKQRIHQSLRIPPERQLLLQLPDVSAAGCSSWLVPVRSPLASLLPLCMLRDCQMMPTVLLMFLSNDADMAALPSMLQWHPQISVSILPQVVPLLCKYFSYRTMTYCVLGVMLVAPGDTLLQHLSWLRKRIAVSGFQGEADNKPLACSANLGPGQEALISSSEWFPELRMDWPLMHQSVGFGSAVNFEVAFCGRHHPPATIAHVPLPVAGSRPRRTLGCMFFGTELRARTGAWTQLQKVMKAEFLDAKTCRYQDGSFVAFEFAAPFDEEDARELCRRFADPMCEASLCQGKLARYRPVSFYVLQAAFAERVAQGILWCATETTALPLDFITLLAQWPWRCDALHVVRFGSAGLPLAEAWCPWPESELEEAVDATVGSGDAMASEEIARKRWADETDSGDENEDEVEGSAEVRAEVPIASRVEEGPSEEDSQQLSNPSSESKFRHPTKDAAPSNFTVSSEETASPKGLTEDIPNDSGVTVAVVEKVLQQGEKEEPLPEPPLPVQEAREGQVERIVSRGRSMLVKSDKPTECPHLRRQGICLEGLTCSHLHPAGAQLARSEPCPFGSDFRDRCPLQNFCAFTHGLTEQRRPPIFRARGPATDSAVEEGAAVSVVRGALRGACDELLALLAQAQALGLADDLRSIERRLTAAFTVPRTRSRAMSRASSYDSFFDGEVMKFVLGSTPGNTQPSTPRSSMTPTGCPTAGARMVQPEHFWLTEGDQSVGVQNQLNMDGVATATDVAGQFGIFEERPEKREGELQMPGAWPDPSAGSAATTLALQRAPLRKRHSRGEEEEPAELRQVAASGSISSQRKWQQNALPQMSLMWHSSPFGVSRTPNIHTPASHRSPARSPTSFSGYCSPIPGFSSGVASPNQRRSGYSSPSTMSGGAFFAGAAQSGLMRRLMSLREARGEEQEEDSDGRSSEEEAAEAPDLLELLLRQAERVAPSRICREPKLLTLDLKPELPSAPRGFLPCHSVPFLNALVQTLLTSSLMPLLAQVCPRPQRLAYSCFMQLALELSGPPAAPVDAGLLLEPLLRRFERGKAVQEAPAFPGPWKAPGLADMFSCFLHFLLGQLHDECKWPPMVSTPASQHEDSPMMRIFGGLIHMARSHQGDHAPDVASFLLLHLDLTESGVRSSVPEALEQLLARYDARFGRLPPFLLLHLERFRAGPNGWPERVSRRCRVEVMLELEEASSYTLRSVPYQLCGAMCHSGEIPESGAYKALVAAKGGGQWQVLDDATVRQKGPEEMEEILEAEGHHLCFLMYRRLDTKTVNLRPHACLS